MDIDSLLEHLKSQNNFRTLLPLRHSGVFVYEKNTKLLNLASNDYLGLNVNSALKEQFLHSLQSQDIFFSSSSSRLLSGNFEIYEQCELTLSNLYHKSALLFNSGYHANISCIQALCSIPHTFFVIDRLIHASVIDGLRLGKARFKSFSHNNMQELEQILSQNAARFRHIIVVSEGVFSMEGDFAPLKKLVSLKNQFKNMQIYLDEAHSVGIIGENGLGLAAHLDVLESVDFLILTFGKAIASMGACMLCNAQMRHFFINVARGLIFSTALPPINVAFSHFIFTQLSRFHKEREYVQNLSRSIKEHLQKKGYEVLGENHILSLICGENAQALDLSARLKERGIFAPAIKEPSVPKHTARVRFSLHSALKQEHIESLLGALV